MNDYLGCNTFDYFALSDEISNPGVRVKVRLDGDGFQAVIVEGRPATNALPIPTDSGYTLAWTDYVANHWAEHYDDLAVALARLAVLQRASERDFQQGFADNPTDFAELRAHSLFDRALEP